MKIPFLAIIFFFFLINSALCAGFVGPGSGAPVLKAADVLKAGDDAPCILEGHIIAKISGRKNRYLFKDDTGQITVEIKKKIFKNNTVTPENLVQIEGEVETSDKYPNEVEAESLTILK